MTFRRAELARDAARIEAYVARVQRTGYGTLRPLRLSCSTRCEKASSTDMRDCSGAAGKTSKSTESESRRHFLTLRGVYKTPFDTL